MDRQKTPYFGCTTVMIIIYNGWKIKINKAFELWINKMYGCIKKKHILSNWKSKWNPLNSPITLLLMVYLISGCNPTTSKQLYENPISGISLEKPDNWDLAYYERSGRIVLEAETGFWHKDSAHIEIQGSACLSHPVTTNSSYQRLEHDIERIRDLYRLDTITIVQQPTIVESGENEVTKAVVSIPTMSLPEDSVANQVGDRGPDLYQTIDIFAIRGINTFLMAYIYKGKNEILNAQAQEIIDSIQRTCSVEPSN